MSIAQINITLGTAGHIDHGKTLLIRCLTGCDTDRLKEEKERGMSIDLGFAPCQIADTEVGIVDVPGHENFIRTMVAGASGMDGVILVVAADDGVMPQTREHMDILTLLGVRHGIVALTKIDRVEAELLEIVKADLREYLAGTFLAEAPIMPLSSVTGEGLGAFATALGDLVRSIEPKRVDGLFRLPVDRSFSAKGYGTVVSGIPVSGSARVGDEIVLLPQDLKGRIRAIQVYGRDSDQVIAGQCAALNVREWDSKAIARGHVVAAPGYFSPNEWVVCKLRLLRQDAPSLRNGALVRLHTGTSEVIAKAYLMEGERLSSGQEGIVQLNCEEPVLVGRGDHFILRTPSPPRTIGGGVILEATDRRLRRNRPGVREDLEERAAALATESSFVEYCVRTAEGYVAKESELCLRAQLPADHLRKILDELSREGRLVSPKPDVHVHIGAVDALGGRAVEAIRRFHESSPASPGMGLDDLASSCEAPRDILAMSVERLVTDGRLVEHHHRYALPDHRESLGAEDLDLAERVETQFRRSLFQPPSAEEAAQRIGADRPKVEAAVKMLIEHERLVRIDGDLVFHCEAIGRARELLVEHIRKEGKLESVKFKYVLDTTRKFAIPLLDHFDRIGVTQRVGYTRHLKRG
ncbi:MAG: selenocysteine-specific translation elongation factor [Phycisphaerae bacterium]|nr:selenocysteine-specific translation elongation factor [Phycisphaerae bacterium]